MQSIPPNGRVVASRCLPAYGSFRSPFSIGFVLEEEVESAEGDKQCPQKIDLDDKLIAEAKRPATIRPKEAVTAALYEYIKHQRRMRIWNWPAPSISTPNTTIKPKGKKDEDEEEGC